jgi:hypothetical protein
MSCTKLLSFASIVQGRDSSVRISDDGMSADVVDTVMVVTAKDCNQANELLRNLKPSLFDKEIFFMHKGRRHATLRDIIKLIMVLPGKMAKEIRSQFAAIIEKHIELQTDGSTGTTTAHLRADPVEDHEARRKRIKREDQELLKLEEDTQEKRIKNLKDGLALLAELNPDWSKTDTRFRLQTEDMIKNIIGGCPRGAPAKMITNDGEATALASLSISQLAQELGCKRLSHSDACKVGALAAKRYRKQHNGEDPPKHSQWVDGAERLVNSYSEADREMLTGVLTDLGLVEE